MLSITESKTASYFHSWNLYLLCLYRYDRNHKFCIFCHEFTNFIQFWTQRIYSIRDYSEEPESADWSLTFQQHIQSSPTLLYPIHFPGLNSKRMQSTAAAKGSWQ